MRSGFSIVVPTFNRADLLRLALESVQRLRLPDGWDAEILVIDNNSTDKTSDVVEEAARQSPIPLRRIGEIRQGASHVRNRGIEEARFEHLVYLDDDMVVDPGWLEGYVEAQGAFQPDCVVGPVDPWFEISPPAWMTPRMIEAVTSSYSQKGNDLIVVAREEAHEIPGCNFGVLRSAAREAGGFNLQLGPCGGNELRGEDFDLGAKLVRLGKRTAYAPNCRIRHFISKTKMSGDGLRARWRGDAVTLRTMMRLRGQKLSVARRVRLFVRMTRYFARSLRLRVVGDELAAFQWELEALQLRSLLFK